MHKLDELGISCFWDIGHICLHWW